MEFSPAVKAAWGKIVTFFQLKFFHGFHCSQARSLHLIRPYKFLNDLCGHVKTNLLLPEKHRFALRDDHPETHNMTLALKLLYYIEKGNAFISLNVRIGIGYAKQPRSAGS